MTALIADLGGTNARLALSVDGAPSAVMRYRGDDYGRFDDVVAHYLAAQGHPLIEKICMAVAGPVRDGRASLTNRDWSLSEAGLRDLTGARDALLINDMQALGLAITRRRPGPDDTVRAAPAWDNQALVVNAGTGFNVCPVHLGAMAVLQAEEGHTQLPANIAAMLAQRLGAKAAPFSSVEALLAGPGLARLHLALTGETAAPDEIARDEAEPTLPLMAELFGLMLRELALRYLPGAGIWLAGSLARTLARHPGSLETGFLAEQMMRDVPQSIPIFLLNDDLAALDGCIAALAGSGAGKN